MIAQQLGVGVTPGSPLEPGLLNAMYSQRNAGTGELRLARDGIASLGGATIYGDLSGSHHITTQGWNVHY